MNGSTLRAALLPLLLVAAGPALADPCDDTDVDPWDTGVDDADCDDDGYSRRQGDCDDFDDAVYPGARERCEDYADNDCDGWFNEGCDDGLRRGSLQGGSSCQVGVGGAAGMLILPLLVLAGRRRP